MQPPQANITVHLVGRFPINELCTKTNLVRWSWVWQLRQYSPYPPFRSVLLQYPYHNSKISNQAYNMWSENAGSVECTLYITFV